MNSKSWDFELSQRFDRPFGRIEHGPLPKFYHMEPDSLGGPGLDH